jgi:hypothetical protein
MFPHAPNDTTGKFATDVNSTVINDTGGKFATGTAGVIDTAGKICLPSA